jgi:hypothetical protein
VSKVPYFIKQNISFHISNQRSKQLFAPQQKHALFEINLYLGMLRMVVEQVLRHHPKLISVKYGALHTTHQ